MVCACPGDSTTGSPYSLVRRLPLALTVPLHDGLHSDLVAPIAAPVPLALAADVRFICLDDAAGEKLPVLRHGRADAVPEMPCALERDPEMPRELPRADTLLRAADQVEGE